MFNLSVQIGFNSGKFRAEFWLLFTFTNTRIPYISFLEIYGTWVLVRSKLLLSFDRSERTYFKRIFTVQKNGYYNRKSWDPFPRPLSASQRVHVERCVEMPKFDTFKSFRRAYSSDSITLDLIKFHSWSGLISAWSCSSRIIWIGLTILFSGWLSFGFLYFNKV